MNLYKLKIKNLKRRSGFTLMEVVIVLLIFTLASLLIAEIFVNIQAAGQRTRDLQSSYTNARYILEVMAREIRAGTIDYNQYALGVDNPVEVLYLKTSEGSTLAFSRGINCESTGVDCVYINRDGGGINIITSPKLHVWKLDFYITPLTTPFPSVVNDSTPDVQPQVTIVLKTVSTGVKQQTSTYLQTSVTSRAYYR